MIFEIQFKQKAFNLLKYDKNIELTMKSLELNNSLQFRFYLETYLDMLQEQLKPKVLQDDGDRLVYNSMVNQYLSVQSLYTEFMDTYIEEIDTVVSKVQLNDK